MIINKKLNAFGESEPFCKKVPTPPKTFDKQAPITKSFDRTFSKVRPPAGAHHVGRELGPEAAGKVLRVKQGYNPNSSSMGSIVFVLPAALFIVTVIFGALSGLLAPLLLRKVENPGKKIEQFYFRMQNSLFKKKMKGDKQ